MKKLLTVSLLAMMAVGTARADIASTGYVGSYVTENAVNTVASGTANGTIAVDGTDVAVKGLGTAAYTESTAYDAAGAAAAVETKLNTAVSTLEGKIAEASSTASGSLTEALKDYSTTEEMNEAITDNAVNTVASGTANGTIAVDGTDVAVKGLGTAAYTASTAYDAAGAAAAAQAAAEATAAADATTKADAAQAAAISAAAADATSKANAAQAAAISAAAQAVTNAGYQTKSNIHTTGELTGAELDSKYPSVGYVDTAVAGVDADLSGLKTTVAGHTSKIGALEDTVGGYGDIVTKNIADFDASGAAAQALADAKGYTDTLATGAVKANTDHIGTLDNLTTDAKTNLVAAINEADSEAADAQADATQALADAAAAQGTADSAFAGYDSIEKAAEATGTNYGTFALTMKKDQNGNVTYLWENIGR